ncbi:hypothetical protein Drorol1_Dr00020473 [Drosera rotundifolia]
MGCAGSKSSRGRRKMCSRCQQEPAFSQIPRSYSMRIRPPRRETKNDNEYHALSLRSTTLGTLFLERDGDREVDHASRYLDHHGVDTREREAETGLIEAKAWSRMIESKMSRLVAKTPTMTPPGEPEKINVWELMEGLEDISPLRPSVDNQRSFSFHVSSDTVIHDVGLNNGFGVVSSSKDDLMTDTIASDFDPGLISLFRKAFQELPPTNPFHLNLADHDEDEPETNNTKTNGVVDHETVREKEKETNGIIDKSKDNGIHGVEDEYGCHGQKRVIVYFTSLRGVRKTYEDCCDVRLILRSLGVRVDERDMSMHSGFREELKEILGAGFSGGGLPRVFAGEKYIGGAEEIRTMHEEGKLSKVLEGFKSMNNISGKIEGGVEICEACDDVRFLPCETCSGSCKIYYNGDGQEDKGSAVDCEFGFHRCPDCNENGLVRCPICCD